MSGAKKERLGQAILEYNRIAKTVRFQQNSEILSGKAPKINTDNFPPPNHIDTILNDYYRLGAEQYPAQERAQTINCTSEGAVDGAQEEALR